MLKKLFILASLVLVVLFVATAAFRYMGSVEFRMLRLDEPGASRDKWQLYSKTCEKLMSISRIGCRLYPLFALALYCSQNIPFKKIMLMTAAVFIVGAAALLFVTVLPSADIDFAYARNHIVWCIIQYSLGAVPCVIAAVLTKRKIAAQ